MKYFKIQNLFFFLIISTGSTGIYLKILIVISVLLFLTQVTFHTGLHFMGTSLIGDCELLEKILIHVGLVRFDKLP